MSYQCIHQRAAHIQSVSEECMYMFRHTHIQKLILRQYKLLGSVQHALRRGKKRQNVCKTNQKFFYFDFDSIHIA